MKMVYRAMALADLKLVCMGDRGMQPIMGDFNGAGQICPLGEFGGNRR